MDGIFNLLIMQEFILSQIVDMVWMVDSIRWIGIEIESNLSPGVALESELVKCVKKFQTDTGCIDNLVVGYVVQIIKKDPNKGARGYNKTYRGLIEENVAEAAKHILPANRDKIIILKEGIIYA